MIVVLPTQMLQAGMEALSCACANLCYFSATISSGTTLEDFGCEWCTPLLHSPTAVDIFAAMRNCILHTALEGSYIP